MAILLSTGGITMSFDIHVPHYSVNDPQLQEALDDARYEVIEAAYELYDSPYGPNNIHFAELRDTLIVANSRLNNLLETGDTYGYI